MIHLIFSKKGWFSSFFRFLFFLCKSFQYLNFRAWNVKGTQLIVMMIFCAKIHVFRARCLSAFVLIRNIQSMLSFLNLIEPTKRMKIVEILNWNIASEMQCLTKIIGAQVRSLMDNDSILIVYLFSVHFIW